MWPFSKRKQGREPCLHGLVHVALYDCPDCGVLHITSNRTTGEMVDMLGNALRSIRIEDKKERSDALAAEQRADAR